MTFNHDTLTKTELLLLNLAIIEMCRNHEIDIARLEANLSETNDEFAIQQLKRTLENYRRTKSIRDNLKSKLAFISNASVLHLVSEHA